MSQPGSADGIFTRWLAVLLSCFGQAQRSGSVAVTSGVEREMKVPHNQPHLVPPMKLVFYDEMPKSPGPRPCSANCMSHWMSQGKELASKASIRASLIIKKKMSKPNISAPLPITTADSMSPRRQQFRPLELSIYLPGNQLSDLPGFEDVAFTDLGEIQVPPKAMIRTRSENVLPPFSQPQTTRPTISMVGERQLDYWQQQQQRSSSLVSQQPPSAFEALNSHPVCWSSFSGLPPQNEAVIEPLSPMAEEEKEEPSSVPLQTADNTMLDFPPLYAQEQAQPQAQNRPTTTTLPPPSIRIPYKKPLRPTPTHKTSSSSSNRPRISISHWLSFSSTTTTKATKPSQFYQCAITPPLPQREYQHQHSHHPSHHRRTPSFTSSSSSSPSISSPTASDTESVLSMTSSTTAPTTVLDSSRSWSWSRSRSATLRTVDSGMGCKNLRVGVAGVGEGEEERVPVPDVPDISVYAKVGLGELRELGKAQAVIQGVGRGVTF